MAKDGAVRKQIVQRMAETKIAANAMNRSEEDRGETTTDDRNERDWIR